MMTPEDWELARVRFDAWTRLQVVEGGSFIIFSFLCDAGWLLSPDSDRKSSMSPLSLSMAAASEILRLPAREWPHQVRLTQSRQICR